MGSSALVDSPLEVAIVWLELNTPSRHLTRTAAVNGV